MSESDRDTLQVIKFTRTFPYAPAERTSMEFGSVFLASVPSRRPWSFWAGYHGQVHSALLKTAKWVVSLVMVSKWLCLELQTPLKSLPVSHREKDRV